MNAGFTPGPWEVHSGYLIRKCQGDYCCPIADMRAPYRNRVGLVRGYKEEWHNARLIAAAPDLYEALNEAAIRCTMSEDMRQTIRAALAKARGGQ